MNNLSHALRAVPVAAASLMFAVLAAPSAHATSLGGTPFNGFFTTTVSTSGFGASGMGTSANSPLGILTETFSYTLTSFPDVNGYASFVGTNQFSDSNSAVMVSFLGTNTPIFIPSTLFANVRGTINVNNYTGNGQDIFDPSKSTGKFAGATGGAEFTATVINQSAQTIKDQYMGLVVIPPAAIPEASSVVSLGVLLMLGGVGVVLTARKKRAL